MPKYIITWDAGWGPNAEVIEAESRAEANKAAYSAWLEEAENNGEYEAHEYSEKLAEELGAE